MASQSLISTVNGYENYIERKGIDEQVIDAYIQAVAVALRTEHDVDYGLKISARAKQSASSSFIYSNCLYPLSPSCSLERLPFPQI